MNHSLQMLINVFVIEKKEDLLLFQPNLISLTFSPYYIYLNVSTNLKTDVFYELTTGAFSVSLFIIFGRGTSVFIVMYETLNYLSAHCFYQQTI